MILDAVIPSYNEGSRIEAVLRPVLASGVFRRVTVVDDGSTDNTAAIAQSAGANVIRLSPNRGKGGAMLAGFRASDADAIAFFDADLIGLTPQHVRDLAKPVVDGETSMSVGFMNPTNKWQNLLHVALIPISGQRVITREVLDRMTPEFWRGFRVEMGLNAASRDERVVVNLDGLDSSAKWAKTNVRGGAVGMAKMLVEVLAAGRDARVLR